MKDVLRVSAPARLHLGFLDPGGRSGRRFGGIGLAIDAPATFLTIASAGTTSVEGPEAERALGYLDTMRRHLGRPAPCRILIGETIPAHSGLGSGTQLALAVAAALRALHGLAPDPHGDAARLGRGNRSGIGAGFFLEGGVVVDGGKGGAALPPPVVARLPFPAEWRVVLVLDPDATGFHGADELNAFAALPPFPQADTAEICRLVLMQVLPGLAESDITAFGRAIAAIQEMVGGHFAPAQGGVFTSGRVAAACRVLAREGAHGIGQSSWGPTGFAFASSPAEAARLAAAARLTPGAAGLDIRIVRGRNAGASIETSHADALAGAG